MQSINVEGLPEPVARAVEVMVETLRQQLEVTMANRPHVDLPAWPGTVIGNLSREEIYDDVG